MDKWIKLGTKGRTKRVQKGQDIIGCKTSLKQSEEMLKDIGGSIQNRPYTN